MTAITRTTQRTASHDRPSCPAGSPGPGFRNQGRGAFATLQMARALEHFRSRFASMTGTLADPGGDVAHRIANSNNHPRTIRGLTQAEYVPNRLARPYA